MWNFQGFSRTNRVEFPGLLVLGLKVSELRGVTQFCGVSRGEALFCLESLPPSPPFVTDNCNRYLTNNQINVLITINL